MGIMLVKTNVFKTKKKKFMKTNKFNGYKRFQKLKTERL